MPLTTAQLATLKADILANQNTIPAGQPWTGSYAGVAVSAVPNTGDGNAAVAGYYNQTAVPAWTVWRTDISKDEVNQAVDWAEVVGLTTNNILCFAALKDQGRINGANASIRTAFNQIFPAATKPNTNAALLALSKRTARNVEKLFSTGTGTVASPATLGYEGAVSGSDVEAARNS
jgi:hypothetical protein